MFDHLMFYRPLKKITPKEFLTNCPNSIIFEVKCRYKEKYNLERNENEMINLTINQFAIAIYK